MGEALQHAMAHDDLIDITTTGRKTGQAHRIEIRFHNIEGQLYITVRPPRPRDWYANLVAQPEFTVHLKQSVRADLPARAVPILDQVKRRTILTAIHQKLGRYQDIEAWVESSPLVAVKLLVEYIGRSCFRHVTRSAEWPTWYRKFLLQLDVPRLETCCRFGVAQSALLWYKSAAQQASPAGNADCLWLDSHMAPAL